MKYKTQSTLTLACHPFMFALKEGTAYQENMMDFSLMLLQRTCTECIRSPNKFENKQSRIQYVDSTPNYLKNNIAKK